jgi:hypothetical protein
MTMVSERLLGSCAQNNGEVNDITSSKNVSFARAFSHTSGNFPFGKENCRNVVPAMIQAGMQLVLAATSGGSASQNAERRLTLLTRGASRKEIFA